MYQNESDAVVKNQWKPWNWTLHRHQSTPLTSDTILQPWSPFQAFLPGRRWSWGNGGGHLISAVTGSAHELQDSRQRASHNEPRIA